MRALRLIVNWTFVLTAPFWILPALAVCMAFYGLGDSRVLTGRQVDMLAPAAVDVPSCMSTWGTCE